MLSRLALKTVLAVALVLFPVYVQASEEVRIVRCTDGSYAVQEGWEEPGCGVAGCLVYHTGPTYHTEWRTIHGCGLSLDAAKRLKGEELEWLVRPPAPTVKYPVEVVK